MVGITASRGETFYLFQYLCLNQLADLGFRLNKLSKLQSSNPNQDEAWTRADVEAHATRDPLTVHYQKPLKLVSHLLKMRLNRY